MTRNATRSLLPPTSSVRPHLPMRTMDLPLLILASVSFVPNLMLLATLIRILTRQKTSRSSLSRSSSRIPPPVECPRNFPSVSTSSTGWTFAFFTPSAITPQLLLLVIVDLLCAAFTAFNFADVSGYDSEDAQISALVEPLGAGDGVVFHNNFFVLMFREGQMLLRMHLAVVPFIANRVLKAHVAVARGIATRGGVEGVESRRRCSPWRAFLDALAIGVALPTTAVVSFFVIVPRVFGPLRARAWLWFYIVFFGGVTVGPLLVVLVTVVFLTASTCRLSRERRRRWGEAEMKHFDVARFRDAATVRSDANDAASGDAIFEDARRPRDEDAGISNVGFESGNGRSSTISNGNAAQETNSTETPISDFGRSDSDAGNSDDADSLDVLSLLESEIEENRLVVALGLVLLLCNVSWIWFLLSPEPASWMLFTILGMVNSSVNLFLCLCLDRRFRSEFQETFYFFRRRR